MNKYMEARRGRGCAKFLQCGRIPTPSHRATGRVFLIHASGRITFTFTFNLSYSVAPSGKHGRSGSCQERCYTAASRATGARAVSSRVKQICLLNRRPLRGQWQETVAAFTMQVMPLIKVYAVQWQGACIGVKNYENPKDL